MSFQDHNTSDIKTILETVSQIEDFVVSTLPRDQALEEWGVKLHKTDPKPSHYVMKIVYSDFDPVYVQAYRFINNGELKVYCNNKSLDEAVNKLATYNVGEEILTF